MRKERSDFRLITRLYSHHPQLSYIRAINIRYTYTYTHTQQDLQLQLIRRRVLLSYNCMHVVHVSNISDGINIKHIHCINTELQYVHSGLQGSLNLYLCIAPWYHGTDQLVQDDIPEPQAIRPQSSSNASSPVLCRYISIDVDGHSSSRGCVNRCLTLSAVVRSLAGTRCFVWCNDSPAVT